MESTIDRILRLRRMGMNTNQVAAILGLTSKQVTDLLKDPNLADPLLGAQVSRSLYNGDVVIVNPADPEVEINVGPPLQIIPGHPLLVDIGVYVAIDPEDAAYDVIYNSGVVSVRLKALVGGVELSDFEDWLAIGEDGRSWQKSATIMTDLTCSLQVVARFLEGTLPTFNLTVLGPDFKVTARHFNADNTGFVDHMTGVLSHGITAANLAAALNAVDDIPGVFTVVQEDADHYTVTAPHKYVQMDVVGADGQFNVLVGSVTPGEFDVPDAPQSITLQDVSIFFGSA